LKNESRAANETGDAANDPQAGPDVCVVALIDPDGGAYLPWGPYLATDNVRRLRAELFAMIDALAEAEAWTPERASAFTVKVQGGVATIDGKTDVIQRKAAASRMAKTAGAVAVHNRVQVSEAGKKKAAGNLEEGRRRAQVKRSDPRDARKQ